MKVLVTGGTGFVGGHLVDGLAARGDTVTVLARPSSRTDRLRDRHIAIAKCDFTRTEDVAEIVSGHDTVIHVAGAIKSLTTADLTAANVMATESLARACSIARTVPGRFVLVSSQAAHGPTRGTVPASENDLPCPSSDYGRSKLAGERVLRPFKNQFEIVIVRPSVVYGPGDRSLRSLFQLARLGLAPSLPNDPLISLIHVHELCRCLLLASTTHGIAGRTFFATAGPPLTLSAIFLMIGLAYGHIPISVPIPAGILRGAGILSDAFACVTGTARPFGLDKANEMLWESWAISAAAAARELSFVSAIPHAEGLAATAQWYRAHGWLWP